MWAQLIIMRVKPGKDGDVARFYDLLQAAEQPGSGLVRSTGARDEKDPSRVYNFVVFESEERARAREQDPAARRPSPASGPSWTRSSTALPSSSTSG
jgi:hypothetical protein